MDRIYMTCLERHPETDLVKIGVFLQGPETHIKELIAFLTNQGIRCRRFSKGDQKRMEEFSIFDHGFLVTTTADGWSFYELRTYIQTYANTWDDDYLLRDSPAHDIQTFLEDRDFDSDFYVNLSKKIDEVEDRYFIAGNSISHFFDGLLKLIRNNLDLYWTAVEYLDVAKDKLRYRNHVPASMDKRDIMAKIRRRDGRSVIQREISFDGGEPLARLHLCPGPFSPKRTVINSFLDLLILHIDDFLFGIVSHRREVMQLHEEIAALKRLERPDQVFSPERLRRAKSDVRLILIGGSSVAERVIRGIFKSRGYSNVELLTNYKSITNWDGNKLLKHRGRFDGILLGAMPHKTKGDGENIIARIDREPDRYPPTVVLHTRSGELKVTKQSIASGIEELEANLRAVTEEPETVG